MSSLSMHEEVTSLPQHRAGKEHTELLAFLGSTGWPTKISDGIDSCMLSGLVVGRSTQHAVCISKVVRTTSSTGLAFSTSFPVEISKYRIYPRRNACLCTFLLAHRSCLSLRSTAMAIEEGVMTNHVSFCFQREGSLLPYLKDFFTRRRDQQVQNFTQSRQHNHDPQLSIGQSLRWVPAKSGFLDKCGLQAAARKRHIHI